MSCFVYHICREQDKYDFSKGYIGVSNNPIYRWWRHEVYEKGNPHLKRAYSKYSDIIKYLIVQSSRPYCLELEKGLRPNKGIGWNIELGGGDPPNQLGKSMSISQRQNIGKANKVRQLEKTKGVWIIEGVVYLSKLDASIALGVTRRTVTNRAYNDNFPSWKYVLKDNNV